MGLAVHCGMCHEIIKIIDHRDFGNLTGKELCQDCSDKLDQAEQEIDKVYNNAVSTLNRSLNQKKQFFKEARGG